MLCHECKEQIELGEACRKEYFVGTHAHYFHTGCHARFKEREATHGSDDRQLELQLAVQQARNVC